MIRTVYFFIFFLIYTCYTSSVYSLDSIYLNKIDVKTLDDSVKVEITFADVVDYKVNELPPDEEGGFTDRVFIDFSPSVLSEDIKSEIYVGDDKVHTIRVGQYNKHTARVVFDFNELIEYEITKEDQPYKVILSYQISKNNENLTADTSQDIDKGLVLKQQDDSKETNSFNNNGNKTEREESFDPDDSPPLDIKVTDNLSFGAKLNLELEGSDNREDLDDNLNDDLLGFTTRLTVAGQFQPRSNIDIFSEGSLSNLWVLKDSADKRSNDTEINLTRAYIKWRDFLKEDYDIQIGRQRIKDDREWIYDDNLDAFRVFYDPKPLSIELSVSTILFENQISLISFDSGRELSNRQKAINYIFYSSYEYSRKESISLFSVVRQDRNGFEEDSFFIGTSWRGRPFFKRTKIWIDDAFSVSRNRDNKWVRGFGIDIGINKSFKTTLRPNITVASAFGSKDFRQTSLEDNTAKFAGATKFKYYGEVFDPELSNLFIGTLGLGIKPYKKTSLDFVYHYFSQIDKRDKIADTDIDPDPTGNSKDIGHEIDLIFGTSIKKYVKLSVVGGVFFPGDAFEENDPAYFGEIELQFAIR